ncbi:MAG: hypothetical protein KAI40_03390 [Desulfobacterales bacterium]|nr:hypothetical protein [Desulfobacterales bacterium]
MTTKKQPEKQAGIVIIDGREIKARSLTRKEVRDLKELGFSPFGFVPDYDQACEAMEMGLTLAISTEDLAFLDDRPNKDARDVWEEVLRETYGAKDEEKNSKST